MSRRIARRACQRGLATLVFTLLLVSLMLLAALFVNRHLLTEQRSSENQFRAVQAFEAAEAGLEWATAQLNNPQALGPDCLVSASRSATTLRDRQIRLDASNGRIALPASSPPPRPVCRRSGDNAWSCSCPVESTGSPTPPSGTSAAPMFTLDITPGDRPGVVQLRSVGCVPSSGSCAGDRLGAADAAASVGVSLMLVPALRTPPAAAVTARGAITFATGAIAAASSQAPEGVAVHTGDAASLEHGSGLAAIEPSQLFATYFGIGPSHWKEQPAVTRVDCRGDCTRALRRALESPLPPTLLWIEGDVSIEGPIAIGSPQRPVALVSTGSLVLRGAVQAHGVLYASSIAWHDAAAPGALLRGAFVSESTFAADAMPPLIHDDAVLATLRHASGSFVRIAGSWRDF